MLPAGCLAPGVDGCCMYSCLHLNNFRELSGWEWFITLTPLASVARTSQQLAVCLQSRGGVSKAGAQHGRGVPAVSRVTSCQTMLRPPFEVEQAGRRFVW